MFITTLATFDMETGECLHREGYEYAGPLALCDRAANTLAQHAGNAATGFANESMTNAASIGNALFPELKARAAGAVPGLGAALPGMVASAGANAAANAGNARQQASLRAMRTGNAAGQGAVDVGAAQKGGQTETAAMQGILGQNAELQNAQQMGALNQLQGLFGTNLGATSNLLGQGSNAANAMSNADKSGWMQNTIGLIGALKPGYSGGGGFTMGGGKG